MKSVSLIRSILFTLCCLWLAPSAPAALSPAATVSLITVSPGSSEAPVYDAFGHTALWIYDPATGVDKVYGYGTYDFNAPNFYGKFVRGQLDYMLSIIDIHTFLLGYQYENRTVVDQVLNLSAAQKEQVYAFLEKNYLPENRFYKYDFFFDNCTTRVRDGLKMLGEGTLQFSPPTEVRSFRQWIDVYLQEHDWADFGMDLGLGDLSDRKATAYESMFLPQNLFTGVEKATLVKDGQRQPLVTQTRTLFRAAPQPPVMEVFSPTLAFWLLFVAVALVTGWQFRQNKNGYWLDGVVFIFVGLLGWVLVFLWFFTDHGVTRHNWNLAWAWPLHLFVAFVLKRRLPPNWLSTYLGVYVGVIAVFLLGWQWWPHELDPELIPLVLTTGLRAAFRYWQLKRTTPAVQSVAH